MPPKGVAKAKGKGKAKAKGQGKAKAKAKAATAKAAKAKALAEQQAAAAAAAEEAGLEGEAGEKGEEEAEEPKAKAKAKPKMPAIVKKVLASVEGKSIQEAIDEAKAQLRHAEATLAEATALEEVHEVQMKEANTEFETLHAQVTDLIEKEATAAARLRSVREHGIASTAEDAKKQLLEAQKKLAMVEVMSVNASRVKQLEDQRKALKKKEEEAKERHKAALEATRRQLEELKAKSAAARGAGKAAAAGGGKAAAKRKSEGGSSASSPGTKRRGVVHPDEQDTVPATLVDGEDIE